MAQFGAKTFLDFVVHKLYSLLFYVGTFGLTQVAPLYQTGEQHYALSATSRRSCIISVDMETGEFYHA